MKFKWSVFPFLGALYFGAFSASAQITVPVETTGSFGARAFPRGSSTPALSEFHFDAPSGIISDLDVVLSISYPIDEELTILLLNPSRSTTVNIMDSVTGAQSPAHGSNLEDTRIDDSAASPIGSSGSNTAPFAGPTVSGGTSYKTQHYVDFPSERLSAFNGQNAQGTWTLQVWAYNLYPTGDTGGTLYSAGQSASWGSPAAGTSLQFTFVPEPQQYAMVFGGLLAIGAIVRRYFSKSILI